MIFDWFEIFNYQEFIDSGLVSKSYLVDLEDYGQKLILVTLGNGVSVGIEDEFLTIGFNDENPYVRSPYAVMRKEDESVWIGIEVPE